MQGNRQKKWAFDHCLIPRFTSYRAPDPSIPITTLFRDLSENADLLTQYGVRVCFKSDFHQKFTVIDSRTVWYGSVNFLSFGTNEESIMRFEHEEVAGELESTVLNQSETYM